jgi:hypothetical protein
MNDESAINVRSKLTPYLGGGASDGQGGGIKTKDTTPASCLHNMPACKESVHSLQIFL